MCAVLRNSCGFGISPSGTATDADPLQETLLPVTRKTEERARRRETQTRALNQSDPKNAQSETTHAEIPRVQARVVCTAVAWRDTFSLYSRSHRSVCHVRVRPSGRNVFLGHVHRMNETFCLKSTRVSCVECLRCCTCHVGWWCTRIHL